MRALGPGSVSSFLKIILDVVFAALWVVTGVLALAALAALLLSFSPDLLARLLNAIAAERGGEGEIAELTAELSRNGLTPASGVVSAAAGIFAFAAYFAGILVIVGTLRRIFSTLTAGDPFHPDNVARLRLIGFMLAGLELGRYVVQALARLLPWVDEVSPSLNVTAWFSVLVVFVLAEVFREGARLRREAELTI
jgi:hypothetical protein